MQSHQRDIVKCYWYPFKTILVKYLQSESSQVDYIVNKHMSINIQAAFGSRCQIMFQTETFFSAKKFTEHDWENANIFTCNIFLHSPSLTEQ